MKNPQDCTACSSKLLLDKRNCYKTGIKKKREMIIVWFEGYNETCLENTPMKVSQHFDCCEKFFNFVNNPRNFTKRINVMTEVPTAQWPVNLLCKQSWQSPSMIGKHFKNRTISRSITLQWATRHTIRIPRRNCWMCSITMMFLSFSRPTCMLWITKSR